MKVTKTIDKYLALLEKKRQLEDDIAMLRNLVQDEMNKEGLKQVKTETATVSVVHSVTPRVNEVAFRQWAAEQPDLPMDTFYIESLDKKKVVEYAEKILNEDGEVAPFITTTESEYIRVVPA